MKKLIFAAAVSAMFGQAAVAGPIARLGENSPLTAPFCETFDNLRQGMEFDDFERFFQVIDVNNDTRKWGLYNNPGYLAYDRCAYLLFPLPEQHPEVRQADDWLLTRAVRLEAGKYYLVSVDASLFRDEEETRSQRFEVKIGSHNDAEGMTTEVIPAVNIHSTIYSHHQGWFKPRATGNYYVGVHGISTAMYDYYNYLFVDNIAIDAPRTGAEPAAVVINSVVNDPDGSDRVDFSLTAPGTDIAGNALASNISIEVKRDGSTVKKLSDVVPGSTFEVADDSAPEGEHLWTIEVSNDAGLGEPASMRHVAGLGAPLPPGGITLKEGAGSSVEINWTAPTADVNGSAINPSAVSYQLFDVTSGHAEPIDSLDAGTTSYVFAPYVESGKQCLQQVSIKAYLGEKESEILVSTPISIGQPYELPYENSFTLDDYEDYVMIVNSDDENTTWRMLDDHSDPNAQDGDNGYVAMIGSTPGKESELLTGKINLTGSEITLQFYTYIYSDDENTLDVNVVDCATGERTTLTTIDFSKYDVTGWTLFRIDLSAYAGKTVQVGLNGTIISNGYIPIDNMVISVRPAIDLELANLNYPASAPTETPFDITATVTNYGTDATGQFDVELLCDGRTVATAKVESLAADQSADVKLTHKFSIVSEPMARFTVKAVHPQEAFPSNNVSAPFQIALEVPCLPAPRKFEADKAADGSYTLSWSAPDLTCVAPEAKTESFEDCEPFEDLGEWMTIDADKGYIGGFQNLELPIDNTRQGFWVMNEDDYAFTPAHSGSQLAVQMYGFDRPDRYTIPVDCDDWLVSPALYGGPQTVSFWARSYTRDYGLEQFEVLASRGGVLTSDFTRVLDTTFAPAEWTKFTVTLPDGSRRFAIRCTSPNIFMLTIDDITFTPAAAADAPDQLNLKGYKVYRNEECLSGADPIAATSFVVPAAADGDRLNVTAVYASGESIPATSVVGQVAITEIEAAGQDAAKLWYNLRGQRIDAPTAPGLYIHGSQKVIVK